MIEWDLLNLDEETASARDVKRAYAKLLRQFRPEKDPEGFERLHKTYNQALDHVKWRDLEERPIDSPNTETISVLPEESQRNSLIGRSDIHIYPPDLEEKAKKVEMAVRSDDPERIADSIRSLDQALVESSSAFKIWENILDQLQEVDRQMFFNAISLPLLLREMAADCCSLSLQTIDFWTINSRFDELLSLAKAIREESNTLENQSTGQVTTALAEALNIFAPSMAEYLLNLSFERLPNSDRQWRIPALDYKILFGSAFRFLPEAQRRFWAKSLSSPENHSWGCDESKDAVIQLLNQVGPNWYGFQTLSQILPADLLALIEKRKELEREDAYLASKKEERRSKSYGCLAWFFGAFMVNILISGFFSDKDSSNTIGGQNIAEQIEESKRRDLLSEGKRKRELSLLLNQFPQIKEMEQKAPRGPQILEYLQDLKTHPSLTNEGAYEALIAYTFLSHADEPTTEALLRCLPHESAIQYLGNYKEALRSGNRLLVRLQINKFLTTEQTLNKGIRSNLIRLKNDYILPGDLISPVQIK